MCTVLRSHSTSGYGLRSIPLLRSPATRPTTAPRPPIPSFESRSHTPKETTSSSRHKNKIPENRFPNYPFLPSFFLSFFLLSFVQLIPPFARRYVVDKEVVQVVVVVQEQGRGQDAQAIPQGQLQARGRIRKKKNRPQSRFCPNAAFSIRLTLFSHLYSFNTLYILFCTNNPPPI